MMFSRWRMTIYVRLLGFITAVRTGSGVCFGLCLGLMAIAAQAQSFDVQAPIDARTAAQMLLGGGVRVTNAQLIGNDESLAPFTDADALSGLTAGVVLSNGKAHDMVGSIRRPASTNFSLVGDTTMTRLMGTNTFDATSLIIDFIPVGDRITLSFVFASKHYPFNAPPRYTGRAQDAMAIFLTPEGSTENENIATVPNSETLIGTASINPTSNAAWYRTNAETNAAAYNQISYGGYTTVFTIQHAVEPCKSYRMRVVIVDGDRPDFDSSILLAAKSITAKGGDFLTPDPQCLAGNFFNFRYNGVRGDDYNFIWEFGSFADPFRWEGEVPPRVRFSQAGVHPVVLTVAFGACADTIIRYATVLPEPTDPRPEPILACEGFSTLITIADSTTDAQYFWYDTPVGGTYFHQGPAYFTPRLYQNRTYYVEGESPRFCRAPTRTPVTVLVAPNINLDFTATDTVMEIPLAITSFKATTAPAGRKLPIFYLWTFGDGDSATVPEPTHQYRKPGSYDVTLTTSGAEGCIYSAVKPMYIKVGQGYNLEIPNAFTPNPDDVNDCFRILHNRISDFKIQVFNRAGQTVFQSNDPDFCWNGVWNGNPVPEGVYIYRIEARSYNGAPFDVRGTVTIFR